MSSAEQFCRVPATSQLYDAKFNASGVLPQANDRACAPPTAAYCHSFSVGNRPSSQTQKAKASYQLTQLIGFFSLKPGSSVHVCCAALQFSPTRITAAES